MMDIFGIGPRIAVSGVVSLAMIQALGPNWGDLSYGFIPATLRNIAGAALSATGVYFWLDSVRLVATRFKSGVLITGGVYRFVRNPMYAGFIVFIVPGLSLLLDNPLMIFSSAVMMLVFKMGINREELYLEERFGSEYLSYRRNVRQIIPFVW